MAKGASIKFRSYEESVPKLLEILNLAPELKKHDKIILKVTLSSEEEATTPADFAEAVLRFCLENKNPVTEVFIVEGADGEETGELFQRYGYNKLAEKYPVSLIDLNSAEVEEIQDDTFLKFSTIKFPKILVESFVISLPKIAESSETEISTSTSSMLGAFSAKHYSGFFSREKNKIRRWPIKYSVHDILRCKMPDFAVADISENGAIFAGLPLEIDKQSAKYLGKDWRRIPHLKLIDEEFSNFRAPLAE